MEAEQIERIDCVGQPVDPELMTVIEVVDDPEPAARDRGRGGPARLHLAGPRAPLRRGAGAAAAAPTSAADGRTAANRIDDVDESDDDLID